jgi:outer membrane protein TolC
LLDAEALFQQALAERSDLGALRSSYEANEASLRFARVAALPLPNLSLSRARDTSDVRTSGAGLSVVLPIWNRGRGEIAIARATRMELQAEYDARVFQARADIALQVDTLRRSAARDP